MNILFLHRSFPAQFKYIAYELAKDSNNNVVFITNSEAFEIEGIEKVIYKPEIFDIGNSNPYLNSYNSAIAHAKGAARVALNLKNKGFIPDIIYGHSGWGVMMFMKDIFPDVPMLCYFEWFQNPFGADTGFLEEINENQSAGLRCSNSQVLVDLYSSDGGLSPTHWQKSQFPQEFHNKIKVIHDGIETDFFKSQNNVEFLVKDKNITLTQQDEVITYGTRGMEPYRGFPQFMEAIEKVLKERPKAHVLIAGEDKVYYRGKLENNSYKKLMLDKLNLDMDRVHFAGPLTYEDYLKFLQISSVHIYLTVPYVLSWSVLEAMAVGCCVVASNTAPVLEVMKDGYNGFLVDFNNIDEIASKIEFALDDKTSMQTIRENARKTIINDYDLQTLLPKQIEYIKSFI